MKDKLVYMAVASDFLHDGHMNMIETGGRYGTLMIGLLTDAATAAYKRTPLTTFEQREKLFNQIKGVSRVVPQTSLDYTENLRRYRPDYVIHGDDWQVGIQSRVREQVIAVLKEWGGQLIELPYTANSQIAELEQHYGQRFRTTEYRRAALRRMLVIKPFVRGIEVSNGLTGLIAESVCYEDNEQLCRKEFDVFWISSLCDSTWKGKPDIELVDLTSRIATINEIMEVTSKPIVFDGDTGGKTEHFIYNVKTLERLGVSAIVIEDKKGLKQNSLYDNEKRHQLEDPAVFADKIRAGKAAQVTKEFMIIARLESLIAGQGLADAWERTAMYLDAGADGIMIHSKASDGSDVFAYLEQFQAHYPQVPVMLVPSVYNQFTETELAGHGANIIIYANHLLRSAYPAMVRTAQQILRDGSSKQAADSYCISISEIIHLVTGEQTND